MVNVGETPAQTTANCPDTKQFPINHVCLDSVNLFLVVKTMIAVQSTLTLKLKVADWILVQKPTVAG